MNKFSGHISVKGFAVGKAYILHNTQYNISAEYCGDTSSELSAFEASVSRAKEKMNSYIGTSEGDEKDIYSAELLILEDSSFMDSIRRRITENKCSALSAVSSVGKELSERFLNSGDDMLISRADDIMGIVRLLILSLSETESVTLPDGKYILMAESISPEEIVLLGKDNIIGLITTTGSSLSHTSIIASGSAIPYIFGIEIPDAADTVILNALDNEIIINPDETTLNKAYSREKEYLEEMYDASLSDENPDISVYANITGPEDIPLLQKNNAAGIGLFRTEFLYMGRSTLPGESEQFEIYKKVLDAMNGREVIIRTADFGSDKEIRCLSLPKESNPALGLRGVRVGLKNNDILLTQLRAILRAAVYGNAKIMFPMITSVCEVEKLIDLTSHVAGMLAKENLLFKNVPIGIMIETPAAALVSDKLAPLVDFFSIGTNDLTQYTLGIDRTNEALEEFYDPRHESVFKLIEMTANAAHNAHIRVGVCGEMAVDETSIGRLLDYGIDELSVAPAALNTVRKTVCRLKSK